MRSLLLLFALLPNLLFSQTNCSFKYHQKKGGNYLFSIYYESDLKTPLNGVCETQSNGKIYERRVFKDGKLMEEVLNYDSGATRIKVKDPSNKRDSVVATLEEFWPDGTPHRTSIYFWDKTGRRCEKYMDFHINGKPRFVSFFAYVRQTEINEYDIKDYPPHTIDYDGFTTLRVPFGVALEYDDAGVLKSKTNHKMILNGGHEHSSRDGLYEEYHHNGKLKTSGNYKDGDPDGDWITYNFNGVKIEEQHFKRNMKVGTWKGWHDNGKIRFESTYDTLSHYPFTANTKEWNEAGKLTFERWIDQNGSGYEKKWNDAGQLMQALTLVNNSKQEGTEKTWFANGQLAMLLDNRKNVDTTYLKYFLDGKLEEIHRSFIRDSFLVVHQEKYNPAGKLISKIEKSVKNSHQIFDSWTNWDNGTPKSIVQQTDQLRKEELFFSNGKKKSLRYYSAGKLDGLSVEYDSLGTKLLEYNYYQNMRHGFCKRFDKTGKVVFSAFYDKGCLVQMDTDLSAPKRKLKDLKKEEKERFTNLVFHYLNETTFSNPIPYFSPQQMDSIASYFLYLHDKWTSYYPFYFPAQTITNQVITFNLPQVYLTGLMKKDTSDKYVKEVVKAFDKYKWDIQLLKLESGVYNGNLSVQGFYTQAFIRNEFPLLKGFIHISPQLNKVELNEPNEYKKYHHRPFYLSRISTCVTQISVGSYEGVFDFYIYPDGEVDLINGKSWDELHQIDDFSRELPYD